MKITAGNLPFDITEEEVHQAFARFGRIASVKLLKDDYGQPTGFGEVVMPDENEAKAAIEGLNGTVLKEREINVREAGKATGKFSMHDIFDI